MSKSRSWSLCVLVSVGMAIPAQLWGVSPAVADEAEANELLTGCKFTPRTGGRPPLRSPAQGWQQADGGRVLFSVERTSNGRLKVRETVKSEPQGAFDALAIQHLSAYRCGKSDESLTDYVSITYSMGTGIHVPHFEGAKNTLALTIVSATREELEKAGVVRGALPEPGGRAYID